MESPLTSEDYESVARAGRTLHERGWRKDFFVNEMTRAWHDLVSKVEVGYDQQIDEYMNDLSCRDWLSLAWSMLTERVRSSRQSELDALDARFASATSEDTDGRMARFRRIAADDGWWRCLPAKRDGAFVRTLGD